MPWCEQQSRAGVVRRDARSRRALPATTEGWGRTASAQRQITVGVGDPGVSIGEGFAEALIGYAVLGYEELMIVLNRSHNPDPSEAPACLWNLTTDPLPLAEKRRVCTVLEHFQNS